MIIWAGSFPRSGSTLWRIVWHAYTGLPTYSYANDRILRDIPAIGQKRLPKPYKEMGQHEGDRHIYMIKTHTHARAVDPENKSRKFFIVRDVRDTVVSLVYYKQWRRGVDFDRELARIVENTQWLGFYNAWSGATDTFIRYEDILHDPRKVATDVIEALDIPVKVRPVAWPSFQDLHKAMPRFFRQGQIGRWRDVLSDEQEAILWEQFGHKMEQFGYERGQA